MATQHTSEEKPKAKVTRESFQQALKIFKYIRPYYFSFFVGFILLVISSLVFMAFPMIIGWMIDLAQGKQPNIPMFEGEINWDLDKMVYLLIGVLGFQGIVSFFRVILFAIVSEKGIADIRKGLYQKMISSPITFFEENKVGDLISRLTADVEKLYSTFSITLAEFLRQIIIIIVGIFLLFFTSQELSVVMLLTIPVIVVSGIFFGRYIRKLSSLRQKQLAESNSMLSESLQSIQVVKAFTNEMFEVNRYGVSINKVVDISMKFAYGRASFAVFIVFIFFGALFYIIWQAAMLLQSGALQAGDLIAFVAYTFIMGGAIASLGNFIPEILGAIGATERVREILEMEGEVDLEQKPNYTPIPIEGNIAFKNVHFEYPTRRDVQVLKGIDLNIEAGKKVALVGSSGAGKSTIIQLLLRYYNVSKGYITVDGVSIYDHPIRDFRSNMAFVPQEVILFGGTIKENILYGREDASDKEVLDAAQKANALEFIENFPDGLETLIGERGVKLSGGQRQRIAIARAILKDPAILLLDEATSALDAESEKVVQDALNTLMEGRTSIIIAHRLATIREVDCIYVLDEGRIVEQGTHSELNSIDGIYSALAKLQFEIA